MGQAFLLVQRAWAVDKDRAFILYEHATASNRRAVHTNEGCLILPSRWSFGCAKVYS